MIVETLRSIFIQLLTLFLTFSVALISTSVLSNSLYPLFLLFASFVLILLIIFQILRLLLVLHPRIPIKTEPVEHSLH